MTWQNDSIHTSNRTFLIQFFPKNFAHGFSDLSGRVVKNTVGARLINEIVLAEDLKTYVIVSFVIDLWGDTCIIHRHHATLVLIKLKTKKNMALWRKTRPHSFVCLRKNHIRGAGALFYYFSKLKIFGKIK